jgi:hypothetical protein
MVLIVVLVLLVGTALDLAPTILILTPVLMPLIKQAASIPVYFGVIFVMANCIGLLTPPVGVVLNVVSGVARVPFGQVVVGVTPFLLGADRAPIPSGPDPADRDGAARLAAVRIQDTRPREENTHENDHRRGPDSHHRLARPCAGRDTHHHRLKWRGRDAPRSERRPSHAGLLRRAHGRGLDAERPLVGLARQRPRRHAGPAVGHAGDGRHLHSPLVGIEPALGVFDLPSCSPTSRRPTPCSMASSGR